MRHNRPALHGVKVLTVPLTPEVTHFCEQMAISVEPSHVAMMLAAVILLFKFLRPVRMPDDSRAGEFLRRSHFALKHCLVILTGATGRHNSNSNGQ